MKRLFSLVLLLLLPALAACSGQSAPETAVEAGDGPVVTVFHSPT